MASKCRKFVPNMFNKTKCQACFGSKEAHSAAALENNKATRKVCKCGYLFVSPDFDFSNPLDRTRRWQRRFFKLYDDGELTYSVDDHADTLPQGAVDMNKCTDILDAEAITTHSNSIAVVTPEKTEYFKADSKEEIQWWHDVLIEYPNKLKALKTRRKPNFISNKENVQPAGTEEESRREQVLRGRFEVERVRQGSKGELPAYATFKGVRSLKHKYDKNHQEGMRKSSSLHDLSSQDKDMAVSLASSRFLSCSGDRLDVLAGGGGVMGGGKSPGAFSTNPYFTIPRTSWPSRVHPSSPQLTAPAAHPSLFNSSSSLSSTSSTNSATRRGSFDDRPLAAHKPSPGRERSRHSRERSTSLKDFPSQLTLLPRESGGGGEGGERRAGSVGSALRQDADDLSQSMSTDETDSNETDELKMARSSELSASSRVHPPPAPPNPGEATVTKYEDLVYMKKGWLIKQGPSDRESRKHWFVLAGNSLRYYKDAKAEESNSLDGRIDLSTCYEVSEVTTPRNYGFKIKTRNGEYVLAAMTSGIRNNWMKAVRLCMDLHSSTPKLGLSTTLTGKALAGLTARAMDDFDLGGGVTGASAHVGTTSTAVVTGAKGETAFQLVGRRDPGKKEMRNVRRHHSDVNPGNVSKMFSVKEFTANLDSADSLSSSGSSSTGEGSKVATPTLSDHDSDKAESPRASKIARHHSPASESLLWSQSGGLPLKRYVEGSDSMVAAPVLQGAESRRSKRNITSESSKEEEKREMMRRAKSPSARIKEKSRAAKTPRLHSPPPEDEGYEYPRSQGSGHADSSQLLSDTEDDMDMTISSEEHYHSSGGQDEQDGGHSDSIGEGSMMVEILESEVESLKERLDHTQTQLVKMHETNIDLKTRLQKEAAQSLDSSYGSGHSGRWSQGSAQQIDPAQVQTMKRQLKEAKDTVQKQRMEIESLKSKLDMSVSKLTGTEKALSEALKEYKQEKDKFLKLSSEWNRRIRTLEGQVKDSTHKLERTRETLLTKERECRRLESETKQHQQKTREQEREILKLKAVEHEYNQLKEQLDNKDHELHKAHAQLHEKDSKMQKMQTDFEEQVGELEREFGRERDDLENHLEELKSQLCSAQERQSTMQDNMTTNMADLLGEKDDIISQLEEKLIENDRKMVDMQEELQAEMSENSELVQNLETLQDEKVQLQDQIDSLERHVLSLKDKVEHFETDNATLRQHLDKLKQENTQLSTRLSQTPSSSSDPEKAELERTIQDLNKQIQGLQLKLMEKFEDLELGKSTMTEQADLLHNILILDSDLKDVNTLLMQLHSRFTAYLCSLSGEVKEEASALVEMVDEIGHRCLLIQETLQEGSQGMVTDGSGGDYQHTITVNAVSSSAAILEEYQGLKGKFDRVVAELKKLKKEVNEVYSSYDQLERKDRQLQETVDTMAGTYRQELEGLLQRVDQLSSQLATKQDSATPSAGMDQVQPQSPPGQGDVSHEIKEKLSQLDVQINVLEKALAEVSTEPADGSPSLSKVTVSSQDSRMVISRLKELRQKLDSAGKEMTDIVRSSPNPVGALSNQQALVSRLDDCSHKLGKLSLMVQEEGAGSLGAGNPGHNPSPGSEGLGNSTGCPEVMESSASSMARCMQEIVERIQEVGEQLDCLEDEAEDSDDEEGEATTVEDVRERLANLCEFVKQHSRFSNYDWRMMQLLTAQKAVISKDRLESVGPDSADSKNKLQAYADRLSLEALILVEMSHLLENKETEEEEEQDPVMRELSALNSKVLSLHQKLDRELRTLCVTGASADVLRVQADIMAEKIMVEGHLCSTGFSKDSHLSKEDAKEEEEKKAQPKLLAAEAIMRSQLDSYIGQNLDKTCDELWSSASHLTTRSLVQGELTFALSSLKKQLAESPHITQSVSSVRDFSVDRLKERHKAVMDVAQVYQEKMIQALAIIISKESEEMTIVEGPENVLDAVCSEVSTIMEKHIQRYKEKVRGASDTQTAHRWDMMVNQLRADREVVMTAIRQQHAAYASHPESENKVEVPFQSLDSSINNFGEIMSLRSILCAHLNFLLELLKLGDATLLADMEVEEEEEEGAGEEEEEDDDHRALQKGLSSFVHSLAEALQSEARSKQSQVNKMLTDQNVTAADIPSVPHPKTATQYSDILVREAVFAAQTTFMMYKLKLLHEQEMDALKVARPARSKPQLTTEGSQDGESDIYQVLVPLEEVLDTKYDDEMETLRVIASQVGKLEGVVKGHDWPQVEEHVRQLEQKVQDELNLAQQRHEVHVDLFKQEESKVEHVWEEAQQEREHFEERCRALEVELRSMSNQHDDEVERMRQDVMTAVSAIRANEEESETQLSDKLQVVTKQMLLLKNKYKRFLSKMKSQVVSADKDSLVELVNKELKDVDTTELSEDEELPPLPRQPPPDAPHKDDKGLNVEEELELLKKEKDEALAEETRNTKAALDAMRKAYEEELQHERVKYRECLTTMYNEDFVNEIRRRHEAELEKTQEELKQVRMHYFSKCEDLKLLEVKLGQTKQDYESHINQLIMSNDHLDDMVNQEIERLKDFIKNRPANLTTGTATMEEELYDAQIMIRVKDAELQKLRSQVKNLENSLHRTTEEHRQNMTQYLQALKENQELRKEYQAETNLLREQLDKALHESGMRRPIRRTPSFHQRARSPSPSMAAPQRRDSASSSTEHVSRDSNRRRRIDPKDLRRSKSSPSLPYIFDAKGIASSMKAPGKGDRRQSQKT